LKVFVYFVGRPRDKHAIGMCEEYLKRSSRYATCQMREIKPTQMDWLEKHPSARKVLLDPIGQPMDSAGFAKMIEQGEMLGQDLVFVLGGHDGHPAAWRAKADLLLSLSAMTWPHELARAMLLEQIYRGFATLRGHPYPR
jgi:23S rRNA (pseudouridine1915-N3)-methyltransferase